MVEVRAAEGSSTRAVQSVAGRILERVDTDMVGRAVHELQSPVSAVEGYRAGWGERDVENEDTALLRVDRQQAESASVPVGGKAAVVVAVED